MKTAPFKLILNIAALFIIQTAIAQNNIDISKLPVNIVTAASDSSKPFIVYITGDGGWNKFSKNLSQQFAAKGYPVVALDAAKYFWDKKTALLTATDITKLILVYQERWKKKKFLLIGYSFGADVMPFVYNHLNKAQVAEVVNVSLLSPSATTDFEIHIMGMLGGGSSEGESVVAAINKIANKPITFLFGKEEKDFPTKELTNKNYVTVILDGGHHYYGDEAAVATAILKQVPQQ